MGIPAVADKVLQMGVTKILEEIYEQDFLGCSYGYRPNVGVLDAVRDLSAELRSGRYHFLVEADIRSFFDRIDHEILIDLLEKRIDDEPFLRLIRKWLKAGILETDGRVIHPETGSPQGGIVSPMLANIYLHYALDVWFEETVKVPAEERPTCVGMRMTSCVLSSASPMPSAFIECLETGWSRSAWRWRRRRRT